METCRRLITQSGNKYAYLLSVQICTASHSTSFHQCFHCFFYAVNQRPLFLEEVQMWTETQRGINLKMEEDNSAGSAGGVSKMKSEVFPSSKVNQYEPLSCFAVNPVAPLVVKNRSASNVLNAQKKSCSVTFPLRSSSTAVFTPTYVHLKDGWLGPRPIVFLIWFQRLSAYGYHSCFPSRLQMSESPYCQPRTRLLFISDMWKGSHKVSVS